MKKLKLSDSGSRGWFVGNFPEAVVKTKEFEVCYQENSQDYPTQDHYHKIVTEVQLVIRGCIVINGEEFRAGEICVLEPGEHYSSYYLEPTDVVAVKFPSIPNDKYYI